MKLFFGLLCLLALTACGKKVTDSKGPERGYYTLEEEFLTLVNDHRSSLNLKPLNLNTIMVEVATKHSKDMAARRRVFGHGGLELRCNFLRGELGRGDEDELERCGEIVAMNQATAFDVYQAWMKSPRHRAEIEGDYTHLGFGKSENLRGTLYWTAIFLDI